ncbi:ABC transporter ATP-binding protein [Parasphingorhabdus sp.]|uniref:ABC transporter ATP-binding protein n=1 Tax=Parasphingorhabdus sp. TaxID=2709688 RepID=UPI0032ED0571
MGDAVITADGLGKMYRISHQTNRGSNETFREAMGRSMRGFRRTLFDAARGRQLLIGDEVEDFWALQDLDFTINRGEVVGIIGRNGAGKSTLLKLLSRITEPSAGQVTIKGRVASLLEVGTGFHPELTGRENIFLNGAILGMTRPEVKRKFDEIVGFAEVEKFLDTPVKRYSSGMYVRLAFSVAAHLEPEILVVDEVLAVGDAEFQRKCLGKMDDVAQGGRTVVFVSHNMTTIQSLCPRAIVLERGRKVFDGEVNSAVARYSASREVRSLSEGARREGSGLARFAEIDLPDELNSGAPLRVDLILEIAESLRNLEVKIGLYASNGHCVSVLSNTMSGYALRNLPDGRSKLELEVPRCMLNQGSYSLNLSASSEDASALYDRVEDAARFSIIGGDPLGTGRLPLQGSIVMDQAWSLGTLAKDGA